MEFKESKEAQQIIASYPDHISAKLNALRSLIIETAFEVLDDQDLVETIKWGEPSYVTKKGSTIRMDWKVAKPESYQLYFICTTDLVATFKVVFGDELSFIGNRAICFPLNEPIPKEVTKKCIALAMTYHKVKHLPLLGC